jgi:Cys-rich protein (TIGR01571 family)
MEHQDDGDAVELSSIIEPLLAPDNDNDDNHTTDMETPPRTAETGDEVEGPNDDSAETPLTRRAGAPAADASILDAAQEEDPEQPARRRVRVIAPSNLRRGYALEVTCDGVDTFEVLVPEGGVRQGQEFTALVPIPRMDAWVDEAQDICCNMNVLFDFEFCCQLSLAPGVMLAVVMKKMRLDCIGRHGSPTWVRQASFLLVALAGISLLVRNAGYVHAGYAKQEMNAKEGNLPGAHEDEPMMALPLEGYFFFLGMFVRRAVRKKYRIPGNLVSDTLCVFFCSYCSLLQIFRHLKRSGNTPRVFSEPTPAHIV